MVGTHADWHPLQRPGVMRQPRALVKASWNTGHWTEPWETWGVGNHTPEASLLLPVSCTPASPWEHGGYTRQYPSPRPSPSALVLQFLKRNPSQRMGGGPGDAADVQVGLGSPRGGGAVRAESS